MKKYVIGNTKNVSISKIHFSSEKCIVSGPFVSNYEKKKFTIFTKVFEKDKMMMSEMKSFLTM